MADLLPSRVRWGHVVEDLLGVAPGWARIGLQVAASSPERTPAVVAAAVIGHTDERLVVRAVARSSDLDDRQADLVARWAQRAGFDFWRMMACRIDPGDRPPAIRAADPPLVEAGPVPARLRDWSVVVDPALPDLGPTLDLVVDVARVERRRIRVVAVTAGPSHAGWYDSAADTIALDPTARHRHNIETSFAHEVGHALDPHMADRWPHQAEPFADRLADLLAIHRPTSWAELHGRTRARARQGDLVALAEAAIPCPLTLPGLPDPGPMSVYWWSSPRWEADG